MTTTIAKSRKRQPSWRDVLKIHPAAELFPRMSVAELKELGEDIKANGLRVPIVLWAPGDYGDHNEFVVLDGRNRLDAIELVGLKTLQTCGKDKGKLCKDLEVERNYEFLVGEPDVDPYNYVVSANLQRLHLTADQKRDLIAKLLKAKPDQSNRAIARQVKADDKTVGSVREELEGRAEIPHVETRTDTKGRQQPAKKEKPVKTPEEPRWMAAIEALGTVFQDQPREQKLEVVFALLKELGISIDDLIEGQKAKVPAPGARAIPADLSVPIFLQRTQVTS